MNYIKPLRPFYGFTQTVFPTVYDDSLSYYESINKIIYTFNQVIKDMNDNYEAIDEIFTGLVDKANEAINRAETAADAAEAAQAAAELAESGSKAAQALAEAAQKKAEAAQAAAETAEDGAQTAETNAVAAQKAAEAAQALAEAARDAAKAAQTAAETARDQSKNYAEQSATSAADAAESAKDSEESANNAKNYSDMASAAADSALKSASDAATNANAAVAAKTAAEAAQAAAEAAQSAAEAAQAAAEASEDESKAAQAAAEAAQKLSEAARDAAQAAQSAAETAKTAAETAATNAAASATQAANGASAAAESASNADADATNAAESATQAANSATQAAASATDAADSAELAKEYADQAQVDIDAKLDDYLPLAGGVMSGTIVPPILNISNQTFFTLGNETRVANLFNKLNSTNRGLATGLIGNLNLDNTIKDVIGIKLQDNVTQKIYMVLDYDQSDKAWYDGKGYDFFPDYLNIKGNRVIMNGENPLGSEGIIDVSFGGEESFSVSANELVYALDNNRGFSLNGDSFYLKHTKVDINSPIIDIYSEISGEPTGKISINNETVIISNSSNTATIDGDILINSENDIKISSGTSPNISKITINDSSNDIKISSNGILLLASNANNDNFPSIELSNAGILISSLSNSGDDNDVNIKASSINISTTRNAPIQLKGVAAPTTDNDAVNKAYVDNLLGGRYVLSNDDNFYYLYDAATSNVKIYSKTTVNSTREVSGSMIGFNTYLINSYEINPPENKYPTHEMSRIINQKYFGGTSNVSVVEGGTLVRFDSSTNQIEFSWYANASSSITSRTDVTAYLGVGTLLFDYIAI